MSDRVREGQRYRVLVNNRAGTVLEIGAATLQARLERAFAAVGAVAEVYLGHPDQLGGELDGLGDAAVVPVVVGGDGTVSCLLPALLHYGRPVGVLPMGTMNLLGRDLGLTGAIDEDVAILHRGEVRPVDIGLVNGVPFHSVSGLGFAVAVASERERTRRWIPFNRGLATTVAAVRAVARNRPVLVELEADGREESMLADAVLVTVNRFEGSPWRRPHLDGGLLEVHLLAATGLAARTRAALAVLTGEWRGLEHLRSLQVQAVTLRRGRRTRLTLDGEIARATGSLRYEIRPRALQLLGAAPGRAAAGARASAAERTPSIAR